VVHGEVEGINSLEVVMFTVLVFQGGKQIMSFTARTNEAVIKHSNYFRERGLAVKVLTANKNKVTESVGINVDRINY